MLQRANFRLARRRRMTLLAAASVSAVAACAGVIAARHADGGSGLSLLIGDVLVVAWAALLVLPSFAGAVKPQPVRAGALGAVLFGPILMPVVFGAGGWSAWQVGLLLAACAAAWLPPRSLSV